MKIYKTIHPLLWSLLLIFCSACSGEEPEAAPTNDIVLRFVTSGNLTRSGSASNPGSNVDPGTDAENRIDNVAVWFYPANATDDAAPLLYVTGGSVSNLVLTQKALEEANMSINGSYDLYVAANLPTDVAVDKSTTLGGLKGCAYTVTSRPTSPFSMTGSLTNYDFSLGKETIIPLLRHAVKLEVTLVNETANAATSQWTINSVVIKNDQQKVSLFEPLTTGSDTFTSDINLIATKVDDTTSKASAYIYESASVRVEVSATIDGESRTYSKDLSSSDLVRNTACRVTMRLQDKI